MESIAQIVKNIVAEQMRLPDADFEVQSSFVDDLGADSLDVVELIMSLEKQFEMKIPDEEVERITTVQQAINYFQAHSKG